MPSKIAFNLVVTNTKVTSPDEVLDFVESQCDEVSSYRRLPRPLNGPQNSIDKYLVVLGVAADMTTIGLALWAAYDKLVRARRTEDDNDNAGIMLIVEPMTRAPVNFPLGNPPKTQEEFLAEFTAKVSDLVQSPDADSYNRIIDSVIADKTQWVPRSDYPEQKSLEDIAKMMKDMR